MGRILTVRGGKHGSSSDILNAHTLTVEDQESEVQLRKKLLSGAPVILPFPPRRTHTRFVI